MAETVTSSNNYTTATKPTPASLSVSSGGLTKEQAEAQIGQHDRQANAWRVEASKAKARREKANAYRETYAAVKTEISAAIAYVGAETEYYKYIKSTADRKIAESDANLAEAMVPLHLRKNAATLAKAEFEVQQVEIEVKALGENAKYTAAMDALKSAGSLPQAVGTR